MLGCHAEGWFFAPSVTNKESPGHAPGAPIVHLINAMAVLWVLIHKLGDINCHAQRLTCQSNAPRKKGLDVKSGRPLARFSTRCRPCAAFGGVAPLSECGA